MDGRVRTGCDVVAETFPAIPASVPEARQAVVRYAAETGASEDEVDAIRLATSEALTNVVVHAYDGPPGLIYVNADVGSDGLSVRVADDGAGLRPRVDRTGMGIGLTLIAQAVNELAVLKRPAGGTEVQMLFGVSPRN